ncbi:hypothetical protein LB467_16785 [Salegentibacter sp. JZCK2]|uniref:hypothetical protein n=1 Tax=Salegentibacter tibetensis TaxID=2873600 RepID=UPI001CC92706|nr:hypothetical protein [Salegentibacter tibetensis]MBZ9731347.1 hypothetical protein [Salegentibacter tibetensis]
MKQKTKNNLLVGGFVLVLVISYQYSFSRTLKVKMDLEDVEQQIEQTAATIKDSKGLRLKEIYFDSIIKANRAESHSLQNNLLEVLNRHSGEYDYKIIDFKEPHVQDLDDKQGVITSFRFILEGEYKNIEKILYKLENDHSFGSVSHIGFEKKKDYKLNKIFLQCSILVQYIE